MSAPKQPENATSAPRSSLSALRSAVGAIGGRVTASRRTPAQRSESARQAARARWQQAAAKASQPKAEPSAEDEPRDLRTMANCTNGGKLTAGIENVKLSVLLSRDSGKCKLCGGRVKTGKYTPGVYDPLSSGD